MSKDRLTPCKSYVCEGDCKRGRKAEHNGYCQTCDLYVARAIIRHLNLKKQKLDKIRKKEGLNE